MKKLAIKTWVIMMLFGLALNVNAKDLEPFSLYMSKSSEAKKLIMRFDNMLANVVKAKIISDKGIIVHQEKINTSEEKVRKYDLNQLEQGVYTFIIDDLMKVEKVQFTIGPKEVSFTDEPTEVTFKPTVWVNGDKTVDFNLMSLGKDTKIVITRDGIEYLAESFKGDNTISRRYDLSKLENGVYTMMVTINGETFYRMLQV